MSLYRTGNAAAAVPAVLSLTVLLSMVIVRPGILNAATEVIGRVGAGGAAAAICQRYRHC